ncbi:cell division protein FtsQ/DivIB, partial [Xanthovirga aplysinae]|uniref:cell division protein FtsQ/DivIB n=1 Tax=Xanthovirga aplysinae TaxID=2529853 RepID=UPI0012BBF86E
DILITIDNQHANYFVNKEDIFKKITQNQKSQLVGLSFEKINLKELEERVEQLSFVSEAQVYRDLKNNIQVEVTQNLPIARLLLAGGEDKYIDEMGQILPFSDKYTARVPLVGGAFAGKIAKEGALKMQKGKQFFQLLKTIRDDEFWSVQLTQFDVDSKGEITIYPQVGKQFIEFGNAENIKEKLKKLKIFYKKILPQAGWNKYYRVNLKYHNQIVCE